MIIGITGHQMMPPEARHLAEKRLNEIIADRSPLGGVTALAQGADQLFATVLNRHGLPYTHIVPSLGYEAEFVGTNLRQYQDLVAAAASVIQLPFPVPSEASFLAAGLVMVERSQLVVAIWDGARARGLGGTADIVRYCRDTSTELEVVWPPGVSRD